MKAARIVSFVLSLLGLMLTPATAPAQETTQGTALPEPPSGRLDVVGVVGGTPAHGQVSSVRSTYDGRVRLNGNGGSAGYKLFVSRAEAFQTRLDLERRASNGPRRSIDVSGFHASAFRNPIPAHVTLCDPYLAPGTRKNPYACFHNGQPADCYDIEVLLIVHAAPSKAPGARSELWTTPVTVAVTRPKTSKADIGKIEVRGAPRRSPIQLPPAKSGDVLNEPVISGDGRLLLLNSGDTLLYSVMDSGATPCDARNWKRLDHVSEMNRDSRMKRYGIARYPIRDSENRLVKPGRVLRGAYPWIDREGNNLFFMQVGGNSLFYRDQDDKLRSRFKVFNRPRKRTIELGGATRLGLSYFGLWSQGKIIIPDGRLNNVDFHLGKEDYQPQVRLYRDSDEGVTFGSGTVTKINTAENQWNFLTPFLPRSPRDVVWWVSANNGMTGEVVFDDALDLGSLIYSPMNAAIHNKKRAWRDGFDYKKGGGFVKTPRIQNAAASELSWKLPSFGRLLDARVEPIAAGGVSGKGLWLEGDRGRLDYVIPQQERAGMSDAIWTTALSVDPRDVSRRRRLLSHPDGSWVDLESGRLILGNAAGSETRVEVPPSLQPRLSTWTHLAFVSKPGSPGSIDIYVQGFKLASRAGTYLRVEPGLLRLGKPIADPMAGFRGWVDELRVVSGARDPESICNYSGGTLRGLDAAHPRFAAAGLYPQTSHEEISARLVDSYQSSWERYRCELESDSETSCLEGIHSFGASDPSCVRQGLLFPEGPLYSDLPRPDSRGNTFCRSCHVGGHPTRSLRTTVPLRNGKDGTALVDDRRRQPAQAPPRVHGFLPKGFLGLAESFEAPPEGLELDPLLYPSAHKALVVE